MKNLDVNDIRDELKQFISGLAQKKDFDHNTDLIDSGLIDSLNFVELILFIEKQYNTKVDITNFQIKYIESINAMADFIIFGHGKGDRDGAQ